MEESIVKYLKKLGAELGEWKEVSERPGKAPFAKELEYKFEDVMWGKIHLRNDGEIFIHVISKIPFNWKDKVKELKIKGQIEDAAGGLLWLREEENNIEEDIKWIKEYLESLAKQNK
ncbi:succinate dehydrogenase [Candidatus Acidianus copahuensis]|uniref:Succinate dehydrogenase n=1 Tax=Candidatus Acidianus copahuensis TaxID=1160895 RepID=A0A031LVK5_9CREN|nr:succinate dehydrogenase [Candidatus Acidianus copahuensis]